MTVMRRYITILITMLCAMPFLTSAQVVKQVEVTKDFAWEDIKYVKEYLDFK